jgi:hypothetical protein
MALPFKQTKLLDWPVPLREVYSRKEESFPIERVIGPQGNLSFSSLDGEGRNKNTKNLLKQNSFPYTR